MHIEQANLNSTEIVNQIKQLGKDFGFTVGIATIHLENETDHFKRWLENNFQGEMHYLERYQIERLNPEILVPGTKSIICCRMQYRAQENDQQPIASFALGKDYPKYLRSQLKKYAKEIVNKINGIEILRLFSGSAPLLEKTLGVKAGLGWQGKNSLLIHPDAGSYFFLGEVFINVALPQDSQLPSLCGSCSACIQSCPTNALVAPYVMDARKCIAYLTIEHHGSIPVELRPLVGRRIFGCDVCQLSCPWNQKIKIQAAFPQMLELQSYSLAEMFLWDEATMRRHTNATPLKRLSFECWLRNLAVALGNSPAINQNVSALQSRLNYPSELVAEHVIWAIKNFWRQI